MIIQKPNITVDNIQIEVDKGLDDKLVNKVINEIGNTIPIIKIGDYILDLGSLKKFSLRVALNNLPRISLTVSDEQYIVREALKANIDTGVIFIGWKSWYIKFNVIYDKTYSDVGDTDIALTGKLYNKKIYNGIQKSFVNQKLVDIFTDISKNTDMGLFTISGEELNTVLDYSLITGSRYIDYFDFLIKNYTTDLYAIDTNYYFHICNIEKLRKADVDTYTLNWSTGETLTKPAPIIFKSMYHDNNDSDYVKIPVDFYTLNTNFSEIFTETYSEYYLGVGGNGETLLSSDDTIGIGSQKTNTFNGFKSHKNPFYIDRINKLIGGNLIRLKTDNIIYELLPFSIVQTELYLPYRSGEDIKLDSEHSGKKIVINYTIDYEKSVTGELNKLTQTIDVI
jgi:hypothetical protein